MLHDGKSIRVAVVGGSRIPFCRAHSVYRNTNNQDMMATALRAVVDKYDLRGQTLGDVILGAVIKHSRDWNLARESVLDSGLSPNTPGVDIQRACGTSLEACAMIANKIALGQIESGIAGGTDSISDAPIVYPDGYREILLEVFRARSLAQRITPWFRLRPMTCWGSVPRASRELRLSHHDTNGKRRRKAPSQPPIVRGHRDTSAISRARRPADRQLLAPNRGGSYRHP